MKAESSSGQSVVIAPIRLLERMRAGVLLVLAALTLVVGVVPARADISREEVERAIAGGIRYLKSQQGADGSWPDIQPEYPSGLSALVTLALLTAGEAPDSPAMARALRYLEQFGPEDMEKTYPIALHAMVYAQANPEKYRLQLVELVRWLERAQIKQGEALTPAMVGAWTYDQRKRACDNSNVQYALLGLNAASEAGVKVDPRVWQLASNYWRRNQDLSGGWSYMPDGRGDVTASMTCAGISSLIISGQRLLESRERLVGDTIENCGQGGVNPNLQRGIDWIARNFSVDENVSVSFGRNPQWKFYYLYGLERAGRLAGQRYFGRHDWYREGAEELVNLQDPITGKWDRGPGEPSPLITTSFALLFLAKGRSPVLINELRHGEGDQWTNHRQGVRNLVNLVSADWKHLLTWQTINPDVARVEDLLMAPIVFLNYHEPIGLGAQGKSALFQYVQQGGFIFAEACCGSAEHDTGFRNLVKDLFPESEGYELKKLEADHPVYRSKYRLTPEVHPLWGVEMGCRTVLIYSPSDLSAFWNQMEVHPDHPAVIKAEQVGQNVVDYVTGRELPEDKLAVREVREFKAEPPKRGSLQIAKLQHAGDWNVAPLSVPNLTSVLRDKLGYDVVVNHRQILPVDPNLINYPLVYVHGRTSFSLTPQDQAALRKHLDPGGGTLFADSACGSPTFDAAFRRAMSSLFPDNPLVPIPPDDELLTPRVGFDLSDVQFTKGAGGGKGRPQLEGIKIGGHWAVIYSKLDIGCALERQAGSDCQGYTHESAMRIATNIVIYSTLP